MHLGERIAAARMEVGLSQAELGACIGRATGTIANWEAGRAFPRLPLLEKLAQAVGKPLSFFTSEQRSDLGALLSRTERQLQELRSWLEGERLPPTSDAPLVSLPLLSSASAGGWEQALAHAEERMPWPACWIPPDVNTDRAFLLRVPGDSMINSGILDGDVVLVQTDTEPRDGDIVLVGNGEACTLGHLLGAASHTPALLSAHPALSPAPLPPAARVIGRVRGLQRKFD